MVYSDNDQTDLKMKKNSRSTMYVGKGSQMWEWKQEATTIVYEEMIAFIVNKLHFLYRIN